MKIAIVAFSALVFLYLVRKRLIHVDLSFPLFTGIFILGFLAIDSGSAQWIADRLNIVYAPTAIIFIVIAITLALIVLLLIAVSRLRGRQLLLVRYLAGMELERQERAIKRSIDR